MEKTVLIGEQERTFRSNGATPIRYRKLFKGADFFRDLNNLKNIDIDNMKDADLEAVEKIAYTMCEDSSEKDMTFEKWLEQFELFALLQAIPEVIGIITGNLDTQNLTDNSKNASRAGN